MPSQSHTRDVPYTADDMLELVADVDRYPDFLPWCSGARIKERRDTPEGEEMVADLLVAYKMFRERFTSRVLTNRDERRIDIDYIKGPFKRLENHWRFEPLADGGCRIHFFIDFEFRNRLFQTLINGVFGVAQDKAIEAFVRRADAIYGHKVGSAS